MNSGKRPNAKAVLIVAVLILIVGIVLLNRSRTEPDPSTRADAADSVSGDAAAEQSTDTAASGADTAVGSSNPSSTNQRGSITATPATTTTSSPEGTSSDASVEPVGTPGVGLTTEGGPDRLAGTVSLLGTPPAERPLPLDPQCARTHPAGVQPTTRFYMTGADGELADTLVYLVDAPQTDHAPPAEALVLDQVGCEYVPYVAAAQTDQLILVKNSDPLLHNVHPTPAPGSGNPESNRVQLPNGADLEFRFSNEELFLRFKCDVHPWMFTYVSILAHPYFAVSDSDGNWSMPLPPPGTYTIEAVHRKAGAGRAEVTVTDTGVTGLTHFQLETP